MSQTSHIPYRQIRAVYDNETITVYQAYSSEIAIPAVAQQKLTASPAFRCDRMTWIKPSFMWMMYRSGYSYKDPNQAHILSIKLTRASFETLLRLSSVVDTSSSPSSSTESNKKPVRIQWDPERSLRLEKLPYRSIQIGIGRSASSTYFSGIVEITDITGVARKLKALLDEEGSGRGKGGGGDEEAWALVPREEVYPVDDGELRGLLKMD